MKKQKKQKKNRYVLFGFLLFLAYTIYIVCYWTSNTFGVGLDQIIFTITSPLRGADNSTFLSAVETCVPRILAVMGVYILLAVIDSKTNFSLNLSIKLKKRCLNFNIFKIFRVLVCLSIVASVVFSVIYADQKFMFVDYIKVRNAQSPIYADHYVDPKDANIKLVNENGEYKNLIYIYLESMETTYASNEVGGRQDINYIPNLTKLADENTSFSNSENLGGFRTVYGTTYTMGALMGLTSGVPYAFPVHGNDMGARSAFASGLTNLGDVLKSFGYNQQFLCGSDSTFAGRDAYFKQHGNYEIFDLHTARQEGWVPKDYYVFWGYEDMYLYKIAKNEILELAEKDKPFNFTMLTVDTHHISGYVCPICKDEYDMQVKNVISCADRQIYEFIEWCKQQSFYEDTVIIISGDHPRMDTDLVDGVEYKERTIYNCFINSQAKANGSLTNREFTTLDMFPTTLAALGFKWDGERLGLGTNLFSTQKTLCEEMGFENLDTELSKKSNYYLEHFS